MQTSRNGLLFIACREAIVEVAYQDGPYFSLGCGHNGPDVKAADHWTPQQALAQLKVDCALRERDINRLLKVPLPQHQFDALISLHYNRGNRDLPRMMDAVNSGDQDEAAKLFPQLDTNSRGEHLPGLLKRRLAEQKMWLVGDYGPVDSIPWWPGNPHTTKRQEYAVQASDLL